MDMGIFHCYGWWTKSCTTKDDEYPIIYRVEKPSQMVQDFVHQQYVSWNQQGTMNCRHGLTLIGLELLSLQAAMARFVAEVEEAIIVLCKELNRWNRGGDSNFPG